MGLHRVLVMTPHEQDHQDPIALEINPDVQDVQSRMHSASLTHEDWYSCHAVTDSLLMLVPHE